MRKATQRKLTWEATQGAERIILIREGRLLLDGKGRRTSRPATALRKETPPPTDSAR